MNNLTPEELLQAVKESNESPCIQCLQAAQAKHISCLANAKTPEQKAECNRALSNDIKACPCP